MYNFDGRCLKTLKFHQLRGPVFQKSCDLLVWGKIKTNFIFLWTKGASPWYKQTTPSIKWSVNELCFDYKLLWKVSCLSRKDLILVNTHVVYAFLFKLPSWERNTKEVLLHLNKYNQVEINANEVLLYSK